MNTEQTIQIGEQKLPKIKRRDAKLEDAVMNCEQKIGKGAALLSATLRVVG